jgi:DNA-binding MarR family transcriptional regulator
MIPSLKNLDIEIVAQRYLDVKTICNYYPPVEKDRVDVFLEHLAGIPDLDYEAEGIVDRINSLQKKFRRDLEQTLAERGLTWAEWKVLGSLWHARDEIPHCSSPGELAAELELSSGAMTSRIDKLERAGLVSRRPDPDDRRGVKVELTEAGSRAWLESTNAQAIKEARVAAALTKRQQRELNALLRRLMLVFEQRSQTGVAPKSDPGQSPHEADEAAAADDAVGVRADAAA